MASFTITNFETIERKIALRVKILADAIEAVKDTTSSVRTILRSLDDDEGFGAALMALLPFADKEVDNLDLKGGQWAMRVLIPRFQSRDTTPTVGGEQYLTFDDWFSKVKYSLTNPLLTNEFVRVVRGVFGNAAISAVNASAPTGTVYGTTTITGANTVSNNLKDKPVDPDLYAGGVLEAYVTTAVLTEVTLTLDGLDINGSLWQGSVTIQEGSQPGDTVEVTPVIPKTYAAVLTKVESSGGSSGAVRWQIKAPRTIA